MSAMRRLHLVRHGRSAHVHDGRWIDMAGVREFRMAYDAAGISDAPPPPLVELARGARVVSSDLTRAIASARHLVSRPHAVSPLLRETDAFELAWRTLKLPIEAWDAMDYWARTVRLLLRRAHPELARGRAAADWLESQLDGAPALVVVTHGSFRRVLAAELARRRWSHETPPGARRYHNWSVWTMRHPNG